MNSYLNVVTPAGDVSLVTITAMRAAAGLTAGDTSRDAELTALGLRVSAEIVEACGIVPAEGGEPTLRRERLSETFETCDDDVLVLSRKHAVEIVSVEEDGAPIDLDARAVDAEQGLLQRRIGGMRSRWRAAETIVVYDAGFATPPPALVGIATDLARIRLSEASVDPLVKATTTEIPDVETRRIERWVGGTGGMTGGYASLPPDIRSRLNRFMNFQIR